MILRSIYLLLTAFVCLITGCAPSLSGSLEVGGGVGKVSRHAIVNITSIINPSVTRMAKVENGGEFSFGPVENGQYSLEVLAPGYKYLSKEIQIDGSTHLSILLEPSLGKEKNLFPVMDSNNELRGIGHASLSPPKI